VGHQASPKIKVGGIGPCGPTGSTTYGPHIGEEFESISKLLIGNQFHVTPRIVTPTSLFR